jgi:hypothetical protein
MSEKTSKSILDELVVKAQTIGGIQGTMHNPRNATQVGQMVKSLSLEDRELLAQLTSDDLECMRPFGGYHPRPNTVVTRKRDKAVTLKKVK